MPFSGTTDPPDNACRMPSSQRRGQYRKLFRRFVLLTLVCSLIPLLLVGWGINIHYTRFARSRMTDALTNEVDHHRKVIELFLEEQISKLQLIARTHSREELARPDTLNRIFEMINREDASLTDLGVIDAQGRHLAYIGPYDLLDKNYADAFWFRRVLEKGVFISDMFLGFRQEPHFIMAVTSSDNQEPWILRATVNTETFRSLVENVHIGKTGEVYLLDAEGIYQTTPRLHGDIMEKAQLPLPPDQDGIDIQIRKRATASETGSGTRRISCSAWLNQPRWLLVVQQDYDEAFNAVNHANRAVLLFLHISALSILVAAVLITRHMLTMVRRRDAASDRLNEQLLQTGKLASIGELSAGVAHEINNPLAIILTERQILLDCEMQTPDLPQEFRSQFHSSLAQIDVQTQRCKRITHNLLRFSRRTESVMESLNLNAFIREVVDLMEREAKATGIEFTTALAPDLPIMESDASQLQQVFLNLVTNAIDAHEGKPYGSIHISTTLAENTRGVMVSVKDTGSGVPHESMEKIFDPFFTSKPVGKGTGLGLSICYSIIRRLGGSISVESEIGRGTQFDIYLPLAPSAEEHRDP